MAEIPDISSFKEQVKEISQKLSASNLTDVYKLSIKCETIADGVSHCHVYRASYETADLPDDKVIMLVGATGTGKSTLINRIANHILGVEYSDDYRFELIPTAPIEDQTESQTKKITIYKFCKNPVLPFNLSIIDTPGFGDTGGNSENKNTIKIIKNLFESGKVVKLDAVGFVVKNSDSRLTEGQRYIFQSVVEIFSDDVKDIIFVMATFCDDAEGSSPVEPALKKENIPHNKIYVFNNNRLSFKSRMQSYFWEISYDSCSKLLNELSSTIPVSLALSKEILQKRENSQIKLEYISAKVREGILKVKELKTDQNVLSSKETEIKNNSNFTYEAKEPVTKMVKINSVKVKAIRCTKCKTQCHFPCTITKKEKLKWCQAMSRFNLQFRIYCTVCTGECSWTDHCISDEIAKIEMVTVTRTYEHLKAKYDILLGEKNVYEGLVTNIEQKITNMYGDLMTQLQQMHECIKFINDVGMKCKSLVPLTFKSHIEKLITFEVNEHKGGYEKRVRCFKELISIAEEGRYQTFGSLRDTEKRKIAKHFFDNCA